jgi:hypothetical protein
MKTRLPESCIRKEVETSIIPSKSCENMSAEKEYVMIYIGPFDYIREKCSACPKSERCMLSFDQRVVSRPRMAAWHLIEIGSLLDELECKIPAGFYKK